MQKSRIYKLNNIDVIGAPIVYWLSREQRAEDNWGLLYAQNLALELKSPLAVVFCLSPNYGGASIRKYSLMIDSLKETSASLKSHNIPFFTLIGSPTSEIPKMLAKLGAGALVCDFDPIKLKQEWFNSVTMSVNCACFEADSHNIVPARITSPKLEWAAYTIRPKINKALSIYLEEIPRLLRHPFDLFSDARFSHIDIHQIDDRFLIDNKFCAAYPQKISSIKVGAKAAEENLKYFIENNLNKYDLQRNWFKEDFQSGLSPYLHFGIISPQRVALEVLSSDAREEAKTAFLEELIIRRELADNFCFYNPNYDNINCAPDWAKQSLEAHKNDKREVLYSLEKLENAETHDDIWNIAQRQALEKGKPHGYLRMYWAKKLLEWSETPEKAYRRAVYLNDKYCIDGLDPNGYAGVAWSIAGVHDRAWGERNIYGKIRYMSYDGIKKKAKSNLK